MAVGITPLATAFKAWRPWLALAAMLWSASALATPPILTPTIPSCLPAEGNGVISLQVMPENGWSSVRLYFRKAGSAVFYFLEMRFAGNGVYWAVLPRPDDTATAVEAQLAVKDADGNETYTPIRKLPVTTLCDAVLTPEQSRYAQNLVVGETAENQAGLVLTGFLCDGVISRIDSRGTLKPDESCRRVLMIDAATAEQQNKQALIPIILVAGGGATIISPAEPPEASKPRPQ
jgi:hypothetical protein